MTFPERIQAKLKPTLEAWGAYVKNLMERGIEGDKLVRSGEGLRSVEYEFVTGASFEIGALFLGFNDYMRIQGMKETKHKQYPNMDLLEKYVREYYYSQYGDKPRYKRIEELHGRTAAEKELTWALANSIRYPVKKKKRRLFFAETFYYKYGGDSRNKLRNDVAEALTKADLLNLKNLAKKQLVEMKL